MRSPRRADSPYPPINDYALISDCHSAALISATGSIDWVCMPRLDSPSVFGRLLDWNKGGSCAIDVVGIQDSSRRYLDETMVLQTSITAESGVLEITDFLAVTDGGTTKPRREILRRLRCSSGRIAARVQLEIRFDYGGIRPWLRRLDDEHLAAVGGSEGLIVWSDFGAEIVDHHDIEAAVELEQGDERWLSIQFQEPEHIDNDPDIGQSAERAAERLEETIEWWRAWCRGRDAESFGADEELMQELLRSSLVLKSLVHAPTGAIAAAPTTSLPETIGGSRNWDYRCTWIRDSWLTAHSLTQVGFLTEADRFRRFVERSAAGDVNELQPLYSIDGGHRLPELELQLEGYRGSHPVRIGNRARNQEQLDRFGYLVELAWTWSTRGKSPDEPYWEFIREVVNHVCRTWERPDRGIWEVRCTPRHFVHSKAMCWVALDRAVKLAETDLEVDAEDLQLWQNNCTLIRDAVMTRGIDHSRGCFVQHFDETDVDASLLLLPLAGFVDWTDPVMEATVDAIIDDLDEQGLIRRYNTEDGLPGREGTFIACTFWLVTGLVALERWDEAEAYYDAARATANDLGLFAEQYLPERDEALGNFPQALSHLAHVQAAIAMYRGSEA